MSICASEGARTTDSARRTTLAALAAVLTVLAAGLVLLTTTGLAGAATAAFAQRCGTHFCVGVRTAYFAGANSYDLFTYGSGSGDTETQYMDTAATRPTTPPAPPTTPAGTCTVHYGPADRGSSFNGDVTVTNNASAPGTNGVPSTFTLNGRACASA
ncbi:hypothetical protein [Streptomyces sp. NPDC020983]|uniref:hypothetical protein n=1 Tax=Streptomyces sp. NPDC020983 TaxID=3365106 RepID=UPI0037B3B232